MTTPTFMTYGPAQRLYEAARAMAVECPNQTPVGDALRKALADCGEAIDVRETYAGEIESARNTYCMGSDDNIEIDDDPVLSVGEEGLFVSAWVWVRIRREAA